MTTTGTTTAATVVLSPCLLGPIIPKAVLRVSTQYPCFIDEATEAQKHNLSETSWLSGESTQK